MNAISRLLKHELVSGSMYMFVGFTVANVSGFLLNLFLARSLSYSDYGIFASLLSVITLASLLVNSINAIIVRFTSGYFARGQISEVARLYRNFFKYIFLISFFFFSGFFLFSTPLKNFLQLDNVWYVILVGLIIAFFYLGILNSAFLQSLLKFKVLSLITSIGGVTRLLVGTLFVFLGFRAFSGLWAIFFMNLAVLIIGFIPLRFLLKKNNSRKLSVSTREILSYALPASIAIFFMTSFTSTDVILVKHFFNPHQAGFYAGLSLVGKVIFYFTAPIPIVMFPLLIKRHHLGHNTNNLFHFALLLSAAPSLLITFFYFLFPNFAISLFLGGRDYLIIAKYLGFFGLYLTVFSLLNVCVNFFLSLNRTEIFPLVASFAIFQIALIWFFHSNFYQVIGISLIVCTLLLILLLLYYYKEFIWNLSPLKRKIK